MVEACGAVFRLGAKSVSWCELRFNHPGQHRTWQQVTDERAELLEALEDCVRALEAWATLNNEPDESATTRARAAIAKARGET